MKFKEDGVAPSLDYLVGEFRHSLASSVITKADLSVYLKKGEEVLTTYFELNHSHVTLPLATEKNLRANLGDIQLTGKPTG
jgi:hypothetical protein